jgi:hypothetical protein
MPILKSEIIGPLLASTDRLREAINNNQRKEGLDVMVRFQNNEIVHVG